MFSTRPPPASPLCVAAMANAAEEPPRSHPFHLDEEDDDEAAIATAAEPPGHHHKKSWGPGSLCRRPWWQQVSIQHHRSPPRSSHRRPLHETSSFNASSFSSSSHRRHHHPSSVSCSGPSSSSSSSSSISAPNLGLLKALSITKRRLRFEPHNKLYFPYEPGKQSTSAVRIRNTSKAYVAFKFQTTAPKSCFMRPPNGVLQPGESIVAVVVKFIELPKSIGQDGNQPVERKTKDKFKIVSLKMQNAMEFTPELFEEHKGLVAVEQILQVVLLDPRRPSSQLNKLKALIAEEAAAQDARKQLEEEKPHAANNINDINVLEEWKQRKMARQQEK